MNYKSGAVGNVILVRWQEFSAIALQQLLLEITTLALTTQRKVVLVPIITDETAPPSTELRSTIQTMIPRYYEKCSMMALVIEGGGIKHSFIRALATSINVATRNHRNSIAATVTEAMDQCAKEISVPASTVVSFAIEQKLAQA